MPLDLQEVARIYLEAVEQSQRPVQIVAETLEITPQYASNRVKEARKRGILPPASRRRQGMNPKIKAIAEEVGVDPYALRAAIIKHSDGKHMGFGYLA